jgi:hypothetical protein
MHKRCRSLSPAKALKSAGSTSASSPWERGGNTTGRFLGRVLLCPTRNRYPAGFSLRASSSKCAQAYASASASASSPLSGPYAATNALARRGWTSAMNSLKTAASTLAIKALDHRGTRSHDTRPHVPVWSLNGMKQTHRLPTRLPRQRLHRDRTFSSAEQICTRFGAVSSIGRSCARCARRPS